MERAGKPLAAQSPAFAPGSRPLCRPTFIIILLTQIRRLWASEATQKTSPMLQFDLEKACAGMKLTYDQFVDVCILAGCDYADSIKGTRDEAHVAQAGGVRISMWHHSLPSSNRATRRPPPPPRFPQASPRRRRTSS